MNRLLIPIFEIGNPRQPVQWLRGKGDEEDNMDTNRPLHLKQTIKDAEGPVNLLGKGELWLRGAAERGLNEDGRCPPGYVVDKVEISNHEVGVLKTTLVWQDSLAQMSSAMKWVTENLAKPSDFIIHSQGMPFVGTLGRSELEMAAAVIVRTCQLVHGDEWKPVTTADVGRAIQLDMATGFWHQPVCQPDWYGLVDKGFAVTVDGELPRCGLMLTDAAAAKIIDKGWSNL